MEWRIIALNFVYAALGVVLMSLVFLSSRRGYDKPPDQVERKDEQNSPKEQDRQ